VVASRGSGWGRQLSFYFFPLPALEIYPYPLPSQGSRGIRSLVGQAGVPGGNREPPLLYQSNGSDGRGLRIW
jgi:hypothetical protein